MAAFGFEGAKFSFDIEFSMFKVTCLEKDEYQITSQFKIIQEEIEDEVLKPDTDENLNPNGTVKAEFSSDLIAQVPNLKHLKRVGDSFKEYSLAPSFRRFQFRDVWAELDVPDEALTIPRLLKEGQLELLQEINNVTMTCDAAGKFVTIGGDVKGAVDGAMKNLSNLFALRKLEDPTEVHIFNSESYIDPTFSAFSADARYLGNITPALLQTTLLDRRLVSDPDEPYFALSAAISLRLCCFEEATQYHTSIFGPKIKAFHPVRPGTNPGARKQPYGWSGRIRYNKGRGHRSRTWITGIAQGEVVAPKEQAPVQENVPEVEQAPEPENTPELEHVPEPERVPEPEPNPKPSTAAQVENWLGDVPSNCGSPTLAGSPTSSHPRGLPGPARGNYLRNSTHLNDDRPAGPTSARTDSTEAPLDHKKSRVQDSPSTVEAKRKRLSELIQQARALGTDLGLLPSPQERASPYVEARPPATGNIYQDPNAETQQPATGWTPYVEAPQPATRSTYWDPDVEIQQPATGNTHRDRAEVGPRGPITEEPLPEADSSASKADSVLSFATGDAPIPMELFGPPRWIARTMPPEDQQRYLSRDRFPTEPTTGHPSGPKIKYPQGLATRYPQGLATRYPQGPMVAETPKVLERAQGRRDIEGGLGQQLGNVDNKPNPGAQNTSSSGNSASASLVDLEDSVLTHSTPREFSQISFDMAPLIPEVTNQAELPGASGAQIADSVADESISGKLMKPTIQKSEPKPLMKRTMRQTGSRRDNIGKSKNSEFKYTPKEEIADTKDYVNAIKLRQTMAQIRAGRSKVNQLEARVGIFREVGDATRKLAAKGPFLSGKVSFRAEFGRILLSGIDESALAFNAEGSRSDGWAKDTLSGRLKECKDTSFTKILTVNGADIEHLAGIRDDKTEQPLWETTPTNRTVYSFTCVAVKGEEFFLNIEVDEQKSTFELRTVKEDSEPIWIHNLMRNWDIRVAMSHTETAELEEKFGSFAKSMLANLQVVLPDSPGDAVIRWGIHKDFPIRVKYMRTLTIWRFVSLDKQSHLDITEVLDNQIRGSNSSTAMDKREDWQMQIAEAYRGAERDRMEKKGFLCRWYEASISSVAADEMFRQNETLGFAETADWNYESLHQAGALSAILKPALRMVQEMDSVGADNDNRQVDQMMPLRTNDVGGPSKDPHAQFW